MAPGGSLETVGGLGRAESTGVQQWPQGPSI